MYEQLTTLKNNFQQAKAAEQSFIDSKNSVISSDAENLLRTKSQRIGFQDLRLQSLTMIAETYNREAATSRYPEQIRNNGMSLSLLYAPNCSVKELAKRATATAESDYLSKLNRLHVETETARKALASALEAIELQNAERQRQLQLQADIAQMIA
ncbi:hypothetical protein M979_4425 [Buttiauxella noackiae ATCC 51607]|uniref:Uncharacterized protein n=1 Tax=Buttiauxella noackiae ATCC 51607 TaxID=1354255 RepID=A0A1B7HG58_9ENTR|nr:hypothetical protein [Buttiauxella noackiae]OAT14616.1 hypothetical protein M979_4425 [Buttiauxella noackiae ATCC 51607]